MRLITELWDGVHANHEVHDNAAWSDVERAIHVLDQNRQTQVLIELDDGSNMAVGGGAGRHNVCITTADERFFVLRDPDATPGREELVTGGQRGSFPSETVVEVPAVLRVAQVFIELGIPDASFDWQET